jgi:hypothetical protein
MAISNVFGLPCPQNKPSTVNPNVGIQISCCGPGNPAFTISNKTTGVSITVQNGNIDTMFVKLNNVLQYIVSGYPKNATVNFQIYISGWTTTYTITTDDLGSGTQDNVSVIAVPAQPLQTRALSGTVNAGYIYLSGFGGVNCTGSNTANVGTGSIALGIKVEDALTKNPVNHATVQLAKSGIVQATACTSGLGECLFTNVGAGTYDVNVIAVGYSVGGGSFVLSVDMVIIYDISPGGGSGGGSPPSGGCEGNASLQVGQTSVSFTIIVQNKSTEAMQVALSYSTDMTGVAVSFSPNPVSTPVGGSSMSTMSVTGIDPNLPKGIYTINVQGISGGGADTATAACGINVGQGIPCTSTLQDCPQGQVCVNGFCTQSPGQPCNSSSDCNDPGKICCISGVCNDCAGIGFDLACNSLDVPAGVAFDGQGSIVVSSKGGYSGSVSASVVGFTPSGCASSFGTPVGGGTVQDGTPVTIAIPISSPNTTVNGDSCCMSVQISDGTTSKICNVCWTASNKPMLYLYLVSSCPFSAGICELYGQDQGAYNVAVAANTARGQGDPVYACCSYDIGCQCPHGDCPTTISSGCYSLHARSYNGYSGSFVITSTQTVFGWYGCSCCVNGTFPLNFGIGANQDVCIAGCVTASGGPFTNSMNAAGGSIQEQCWDLHSAPYTAGPVLATFTATGIGVASSCSISYSEMLCTC